MLYIIFKICHINIKIIIFTVNDIFLTNIERYLLFIYIYIYIIYVFTKIYINIHVSYICINTDTIQGELKTGYT